MVFSSPIFLFLFLPIVVLVHYVIKEKYRNLWLILASIFFYGWAQPKCLLILAFNILCNYFIGCFLGKKKYKGILILGIVLNLSTLLYFKYTNFLIEIVNSITSSSIDLLTIVLPIGISFYTFKGISYLADIYNGKICPEKNPTAVIVYILMFPQILSGPIEKYENVITEIHHRVVTVGNLSDGARRFIVGLSQKAIIANSLGMMVDSIWALGAGTLSLKTAWLGSVGYTLQIFFDFAGYSNMAIGIGTMLGFQFCENFNLPYVATSVTDFWRRWHISLGRWFRDYIYIPLGGNRKHVYLNIAIVFFLTGVWHGAAWNFVVWGCLHGVFRLIEKMIDTKGIKMHLPQFIRRGLSHFYLLFVVNLGWVLFRAPSLNEAGMFIKRMIGLPVEDWCGVSVLYFLTRWNVFILAVAVLFASSVPRKMADYVKKRTQEELQIVVRDIALLALLACSILRVVAGSYNSFIYFQF